MKKSLARMTYRLSLPDNNSKGARRDSVTGRSNTLLYHVSIFVQNTLVACCVRPRHGYSPRSEPYLYKYFAGRVTTAVKLFQRAR